MKIENWKFKIYNRKGFSFIEVIVVVAFIGIMTSIVLVSFQDSKEKKAVETEARKVAAAIREAQNDALTGKSAGNNCVYTFSYSNVGGTGNYGISGCVTVNYTMTPGVNFTSTTGSFSFATPWGVISGLSNMPIKITKGSASNYVCVYQSGNVVENGTNAVCP